MSGALIALGSYICLAVGNCLIYKKAVGALPIQPLKSIVSSILILGGAVTTFIFRKVVLSRALLLLATLPVCFSLVKKLVQTIKEG